ncbi:hypothetical protein PEY55_21745 [Citrobacter portucalensis]|uniref:Ead/Ea22-like family protein n=1 Tax=Citrobacter portucalensis TaxID=1639133 RepID=A0AAW7LWU9_9ENTR|nr:hypothetical protein [Citrobacter portucalensis]MDN4370879.1 hypothetical protein [Citrobacter portucalensis]MHV60805.1 hypothetical protein [Escherichia coli]
MNATEKDNVFYCDCGFSWRRGMSGSHNCEDGLRAKLTDMAVQLANAESKCRELAAEVQVVRWACGQVYMKGYNHGHLNTVDGLEYASDTELVERGGETLADFTDPDHCGVAADAILAELRAQVWIEGSEPEEFGRYWVRYETDMGPQYCSAKWMEHNFCAGSNTNIHKIWLADHSRSINSLRGVTHYTKLPDSLEGAAK